MEQRNRPVPKLTISQWCVEDRPREKYARKGSTALTDAELLAILLRTGKKRLCIYRDGAFLTAADLDLVRQVARILVSEYPSLSNASRKPHPPSPVLSLDGG